MRGKLTYVLVSRADVYILRVFRLLACAELRAATTYNAFIRSDAEVDRMCEVSLRTPADVYILRVFRPLARLRTYVRTTNQGSLMYI